MTYQQPEPTPSVPAAPHPSVDRLADLQEELLSPEHAREVHEHLADCPQCADTLAALAELTDVLGADEPPAMPADVALRIDAVLAAELEPTPTPSPAPRTAPPARQDRHIRPGHPGRPAARRRVRLLLAATGCLAVLGLGIAVVDSANRVSTNVTASSAKAADTAQRPADAASGPDFTAAQLPQQIQQLLAERSPAAGLPHAATAQGGQGEGGSSTLPSCVRAAVGGHAADSPLTVGHGRYDATPVDAYVFHSATDPAQLDVYLLTPGCSGQGAAGLLLHQSVPAH